MSNNNIDNKSTHTQTNMNRNRNRRQKTFFAIVYLYCLDYFRDK